MEECLIINIEKKDKETTYSLEDLYQELFYWLHYQVKKLCTGKSNAPILDFISESTGDGWVDEGAVYISFRNSGGMCEMSQNVALHWFTLSYHLLYPQLKVLLKGMGYSIAKQNTSLEALLAKTIHHPIAKLKGGYYNIYENSDNGIELMGDDEIFDVSGLSKVNFNKLKKQLKEEKCQCSLCIKLMKNKYKLIDIKALKAKEAEKTEYTTISSALRKPRSAKSLYITNSSIKELPPEIGQLVYLKKFVFYDNHYIKSIPKEIGRLKRLKSLKLYNNRELVVLPVEVFDCSNLEELEIASTEIGNLPPEIKQLTRLKRLELQPSNFVTVIRVPEEIGELKSLEDLNLMCVENKIPNTIYECTELRRLYLNTCKVDPIPSAIGNLTKLEKLDFINCNLKELSKDISKLVNLEFLSLSRNPISSTELNKIDFSHFQKMTHLHLEHTSMTTLPKSIYQLKKLEVLPLGGNKGLMEIDEAIQELSNLKHLGLGGTNITTLPESLGKLKKLELLNLNDTKIKEIPVAIKGLESLTQLSLIGTRLSTLPEWLNDLPSLKYLNLRYCPNAKQMIKSLNCKPKFNIQIE